MSSDQNKIIKVVQSSTRKLVQSFLQKAELLSGIVGDVRNLIREGYDAEIAFNTARKMFGSEKVKFLAIDGTKSEDQRLDILIFYAAAFGYQGEVDFIRSGCTCCQPSAVDGSKEISTAIPIHELDAGNILGIISEGGVEIDPERLPSALMHLSEYLEIYTR